MPIRKENLKRYPKNWKQISEDIRFNRAKNKCEICGVVNHSYINRHTREICLQGEDDAIRVVLTVAHLDHKPENCDYSNLLALCQKCHNNYDRIHRNLTRKESQKNINQLTIKTNM
jgi:ribosomal protein S14